MTIEQRAAHIIAQRILGSGGYYAPEVGDEIEVDCAVWIEGGTKHVGSITATTEIIAAAWGEV